MSLGEVSPPTGFSVRAPKRMTWVRPAIGSRLSGPSGVTSGETGRFSRQSHEDHAPAEGTSACATVKKAFRDPGRGVERMPAKTGFENLTRRLLSQ